MCAETWQNVVGHLRSPWGFTLSVSWPSPGMEKPQQASLSVPCWYCPQPCQAWPCPALLNQKLQCNEILRVLTHTVSFEKCWFKTTWNPHLGVRITCAASPCLSSQPGPHKNWGGACLAWRWSPRWLHTTTLLNTPLRKEEHKSTLNSGVGGHWQTLGLMISEAPLRATTYRSTEVPLAR